MRRIRQRVSRLERTLGGGSGLHFLLVEVGDGETKDEALERALAERGISRNQLGHVLYLGGDHGLTSEDWRPYARPEELVGYRAFFDELKALMASSNGVSIKLPSERGEFPE